MKKFVSNNLEESKKFAEGFAKEILVGKRAGNKALVLALIGDLGSGKTTFAQSFAGALGVKEKIKSPTFIIFRKSKIGKKNGEKTALKIFIILTFIESITKKRF